jgi:5-methyltetrahydrofolate--homocysteine methyltransferase
MYNAFRDQVVALEKGGADGVVVETMTALEEASIAIRATRENTRLVVAATMTFDKGPRGYFTMMGITPEKAAEGLGEAGADIVGSNCGNGIENMIEIAQKMRMATRKPILVHSNAGIPDMKKGEIIYPESPEYMVEGFQKLKESGVNIIGGCCGTGPEHIKALADII